PLDGRVSVNTKMQLQHYEYRYAANFKNRVLLPSIAFVVLALQVDLLSVFCAFLCL
uniref:Uncharacterized protein n=1 Tax=Amphimedon queenslandica TaxID=400682 RepID=A0A1X7VX48_AMPQE